MENLQRDLLEKIVNQIYNFENRYEDEILANASDWIELLQEYFPKGKDYYFIENIALRTAIELLSKNLGEMVNRSDMFFFDFEEYIENNIKELNSDDTLEIYNHIFQKNLQEIAINEEKIYGINEDDRFESISISHIKEVLAITFERLLKTQLELLKVRFFYLPKNKEFYEKIKFYAEKETIDEIIANVTGQQSIIKVNDTIEIFSEESYDSTVWYMKTYKKLNLSKILGENIIEVDFIDDDKKYVSVVYSNWDSMELSAIIDIKGHLIYKGICIIHQYIVEHELFIIEINSDYINDESITYYDVTPETFYYTVIDANGKRLMDFNTNYVSFGDGLFDVNGKEYTLKELIENL